MTFVFSLIIESFQLLSVYLNILSSRAFDVTAVGGVYGKPILITPLLKDDLNYINKIYEGNIKVKDEALSRYDSAALKAVRAAARANLEIWGINEIGDRLKELYIEAMK